MDLRAVLVTPKTTEWNDLPVELQLETFQKLDFECLYISRLVCKKWNEQISEVLRKLGKHLDTLLNNTEPRFSTSSSPWPIPPVIEVVSHDTIVVRMRSSLGSLRIKRENMDKWDLFVQGNIFQCNLSENLLLITINNLDHTKRIEVYDTTSRAKLLTRELGDWFGTIFFSGSHILIHHMSTLSTSTGEIIDVNNPSSSFQCQINQVNYKSVINYSYPYLILFSNEKLEMEVRKIDAKSKSVNKVKNLDYDKMKIEISKSIYDSDFILKDVVYKKHHIFALLRTRSNVEFNSWRLLVFSSKGVLVSKMSFLGQLLSWSHTFGGYFTVTMARLHKNVVNLFNTNDFINKGYIKRPLRTFTFEEKVQKGFDRDCDFTTFKYNTIKRVVASGTSIIVEKFEFLS